MKQAGYILAILVLSASCSPRNYCNREIRKAEQDFQDHIGFVLYDPQSKKTLADYQGGSYFTPASNTKIFTLYASLQILGDSIPGLRYVKQNDSIIFWGTGDPSFLYPNTVSSSRVYDFLKDSTHKLFFSSSNFHTPVLGPGWAWGDYVYTYQVERTPFPIYGNRYGVKKVAGGFISNPIVFNPTVRFSADTRERAELIRDQGSNELTYFKGKRDRVEWEVPIHYSDDLLVKILSDTLKREVKLISQSLAPGSTTFYSVPADSLYKIMMQESDNFIAEQLLMMCANALADSLRPEIAIRFMKKNSLLDLPDEPAWVDGSGLSRYNLFTPRSVVSLWEKMYSTVPRDRLMGLLAVGGVNGTIKDYYKAEKPFIFGKTGTLSNNHSLSGYLVTKKGRTLIFSWMNNNFTSPSAAIRTRMEGVLKWIYEKY